MKAWRVRLFWPPLCGSHDAEARRRKAVAHIAACGGRPPTKAGDRLTGFPDGYCVVLPPLEGGGRADPTDAAAIGGGVR